MAIPTWVVLFTVTGLKWISNIPRNLMKKSHRIHRDNKITLQLLSELVCDFSLVQSNSFSFLKSILTPPSTTGDHVTFLFLIQQNTVHLNKSHCPWHNYVIQKTFFKRNFKRNFSLALSLLLPEQCPWICGLGTMKIDSR